MAKERKQSRVEMNNVGGGNRNSNDQEDPGNAERIIGRSSILIYKLVRVTVQTRDKY
jgi:hypothetical protein